MTKRLEDFLSEKQITFMKDISSNQSKLMTEYGVDASDMLLKFDFEGTCIVDPFLDEIGAIEVDPVEYYGEAFINSDFLKKFLEK